MARKAGTEISVPIEDGVENPDHLRAHSNLCTPDPRNQPSTSEADGFGRTSEQHHAAVAELILADGVPENVRVQFETSKNLYLYAWFVFRFYPVAELHALTCLELALRIRFRDELPATDERRPGLHRLLMQAIKNGVLKNENFDAWRRRTAIRAESRAIRELIDKMGRLGLQEAEFDETSIVITDDDRDHDYLRTVLENIPKIRNHYAHGSSSLHDQVLGTLRLVQEIVNQLFPERLFQE